MKRRTFITLLGGAAASWPLAARAQQTDRVRRVSVLTNLAETDPEARARMEAFQQGLQHLGWSVGQNLQIDTRSKVRSGPEGKLSRSVSWRSSPGRRLTRFDRLSMISGMSRVRTFASSTATPRGATSDFPNWRKTSSAST